MRRLTFIAEADIHKGKIPKLDHCPFCNGELPKEKTQSCLDAAIAEADKIELRIKDLQYADEALSKEMEKLQSQRDALVREQQQVQAAIRGELRPQVEALRDKLAIFTAALEKAKAKQMLKHFTEVLNEQLLRIKNEDEFSNDFDVREKIRDVLQEPLERLCGRAKAGKETDINPFENPGRFYTYTVTDFEACIPFDIKQKSQQCLGPYWALIFQRPKVIESQEYNQFIVDSFRATDKKSMLSEL